MNWSHARSLTRSLRALLLLLLVASSFIVVTNVSAFSQPPSSIRNHPLFGSVSTRNRPIRPVSTVNCHNERPRRLPQFLSRTIAMNQQLGTQLRRAFALLCVSVMLWLASTTVHVQPAYATTATATTATIVQRILPSASTMETMMEHYVQDHMFDDDVYDPLESAYREAYHDSTVGQYPKSLKEITTSIMGKEKINQDHNIVVATMLHLSSGLKRIGLSEGTALAVLAGGTILGVPLLSTVVAMSYIAFNKRRLVGSMKKRYGDDYSVEAAIKTNEDVEDPSEEDDDDGDGDDDDDDGT